MEDEIPENDGVEDEIVMDSEPKDKIQKPGMFLTINGGKEEKEEKEEMEAATLPIQWNFDPEICEQGPTHVIIVEQNELEFNALDLSNANGRRYLVVVGDVIKWLQIFSAGVHKITAYAVRITDDRYLCYIKERLQSKEGNFYLSQNSYRYSVSDMLSNINMCALAVTEDYVKVPKELFAQKPKSGLSLDWYNWVHLWHNEPVDECSYRSRIIFAVSLKPIAYLLLLAFKLVFASAMATLAMVASLLSTFMGWKLDEVFGWPCDVFKNAFKLKGYIPEKKITGGYKVWGSYDSQGKWHSVKLPVSGLELLAVGALVWTSYTLGLTFFVIVMSIVLTLAIALGIFKDSINSHYKSYYEKLSLNLRHREQIEADREKKRQETYAYWVRNNLSTFKKPIRVDTSRVPDPYNGKLKNFIYRKFWQMKEKVCRPYER